MQWLNLEMSVLENESFGCAETAAVGTWLRLTRYCCVQENGGRIRGARAWDDRKWMFLCRLQKSETEHESALWTWKNDDLIVHFFPHEKLREVKRLRRQASSAANSRWEKARANRHSNGMPNGMPSGSPKTESGNAEREGERKEKGKRREREGGISHQASRPESLAEVVTFFATMKAPADVAADFFDHFQANNWTQGGRPDAPLAEWEPEGRKWIRRWERDQKKLKSAAPGTQAHEHTGGVPVAN